ncbi:MAG: hypothetical protein AAF479_04130 [Pseudomonadota bacterium]
MEESGAENSDPEDESGVDQMIAGLVDLSHRLLCEFEPAKISRQLNSADLDDRLSVALFSTYHLLISGAVAEANVLDVIAEAGEGDLARAFAQFSRRIQMSRFDGWDAFIIVEGWRGRSVGGARNQIGSLAFLVVLLFFFEGFVKLVIQEGKGKVPRNASGVLKWIKERGCCTEAQLEALAFANEYRNAWHAMGVVRDPWGNGVPPQWHGHEVVPGARVKPLPLSDRLALVVEVVEAMLRVNASRDREN